MLARRIDALEATAEAIRTAYGVQVRTVSLDLSSPDVGVVLGQHIDGLDIALLVYNAAYSTIAPYHQVSLEEKQRHLAVNCHGPLVLSSVLAPAMIRRGRGGMIFMSSATSLRGTYLLATYAATKAFNTLLAESLWHEFQPYGVDVLGVIAGATKTPNYERTQPASLRFAPAAQDPDALARGASTAGQGCSHLDVHLAGRLGCGAADAASASQYCGAVSE
jgi:short-subunit dehydrogenase